MEPVLIGFTILAGITGIASASFILDRAINGKIQRLASAVDRLEKILEDLWLDEHAHRQAGLTFARAQHDALRKAGIDSPDPDHFPGI